MPFVSVSSLAMIPRVVQERQVVRRQTAAHFFPPLAYSIANKTNLSVHLQENWASKMYSTIFFWNLVVCFEPFCVVMAGGGDQREGK